MAEKMKDKAEYETKIKHRALTKKVGNKLRALCKLFVDTNDDLEAQESLREIGHTMGLYGLGEEVHNFILDLEEKREKSVRQRMDIKDVQNYLRGLCRDYMVAKDKDLAKSIRDELAYELYCNDLYSERLLRKLEWHRYHITNAIREYSTCKIKHINRYWQLLVKRLNEANIDKRDITKILEGIER